MRSKLLEYATNIVNLKIYPEKREVSILTSIMEVNFDVL